MKTILVADDNPDDVQIITDVCKRIDTSHNLRDVRDGQSAIDYLCGDKEYSNRLVHPFPDLMVLDLEMPYRGGFDVLEWLRDNPMIHPLRAIVLTGSLLQENVTKAYEFGAVSYLAKRATAEQYLQLLETTFTYWLKINIPPPNPNDLTRIKSVRSQFERSQIQP